MDLSVAIAITIYSKQTNVIIIQIKSVQNKRIMSSQKNMLALLYYLIAEDFYHLFCQSWIQRMIKTIHSKNGRSIWVHS